MGDESAALGKRGPVRHGNTMHSHTFSLRLIALTLLLIFTACLSGQDAPPRGDAAFFEDSPAWQSLFDGHQLGAWRFLHGQEIDPHFWHIENGLLRTLPGGKWGADIITRDIFDNFAFCAEWKTVPNGNSGIIYNVREDQWRGQTTLPATMWKAKLALAGGVLLALLLLFLNRGFLRYEIVRGFILGLLALGLALAYTPFKQLLDYDHYMRNLKAAGLEMQIYDDFGSQTEDALHGNGALYDIFPVTSRAGKPAGEWNESCLVVDGNDVSHWVNRVRVVSYTLGSPELTRAISKSNYRSLTGVAEKHPMRVAIQNHDGQEVWFRGIRVRRF